MYILRRKSSTPDPKVVEKASTGKISIFDPDSPEVDVLDSAIVVPVPVPVTPVAPIIEPVVAPVVAPIIEQVVAPVVAPSPEDTDIMDGTTGPSIETPMAKSFLLPRNKNKLESTTLPLPQAVINERTMTFRMDNRTLWTRYSLGMINYSVSLFGGLGSTDSVEANLARAAAAIGDYFIPFYGITAGNKIGSLLVVISKNGTKIVQAIKDQKDYSPYLSIWTKQIDELSKYLNELNPSQYPAELLSGQLTALTDLWVTDFNARYQEDFITDTIALDNILKVAVSGIPNHTRKGYTSIADILSRGIIAQFPLTFME